MEWPEHLTVFVEVAGSILKQPSVLPHLPTVEGLVVHDERLKIQLEKTGVKSKVVLAISVTNGWLVEWDEARLVCLKPAMPLDLRALRKEIDAYYPQNNNNNDEDGFLLLNLPPMALVQCRTLLDLLCLSG